MTGTLNTFIVPKSVLAIIGQLAFNLVLSTSQANAQSLHRGEALIRSCALLHDARHDPVLPDGSDQLRLIQVTNRLGKSLFDEYWVEVKTDGRFAPANVVAEDDWESLVSASHRLDENQPLPRHVLVDTRKNKGPGESFRLFVFSRDNWKTGDLVRSHYLDCEVPLHRRVRY